jgi:penicillin amidase
MKWILRIIITILVLLGIGIAFLYHLGSKTKPIYEGNIGLSGLKESVDVYYDSTGIPHIEAKNKHDLYMAFGYVHAQDRLFQMELLRRAGKGRLSEIIGGPMVKVDKIFHTIGLPEYAKQSAALMEKQKGSDSYSEITAYLEGINSFIREDKLPPEFSIIGIPKEEFTLEDMYAITGAMSFSFSQGQKTEPVVDFIAKNYGNQHLKDIALWHDSNESSIPNFDNRSPKDTSKTFSQIGSGLMNAAESLPFAPLEGSNAWVVGGSRTKSSKVLFCNDTHIGYLAPQTWYEAYLTCPGFELYGHFMAAVPYALVGRNQDLSWGLTMLLNDDMDFYKEKIIGDSVMYKGKMEALTYHDVTIVVKDSASVQLHIPITPHGPIVNGAFESIESSTEPISMCWTYTKKENQAVDAFRGMNNAHDMASFEKEISKIHAPGLSLNYGDAKGNIAWWACASLVIRPEQVNPWTLLDGASGQDDWLGYYTFEQNPRNINPEEGFIYSANDWPSHLRNTASSDSMGITDWYPGYYKPQYRADRISKLLRQSESWDMTSIQTVMNDITSDADSEVMRAFLGIVSDSINISEHELYRQYFELFDWDGTYQRDMYQPTFFTKMLYHYLHETCADELGEEQFELFLTTHQVQRAQNVLIKNRTSPWWDDVTTVDKKETRKDIIFKAFEKSITELRDQFGSNPKIWNWRKACQLEVKHPLGEVALLRPIFNIGPEPVDGSNETIQQSGFYLNGDGEYKVFFGSQMRIIVDFAHPDSAINITPCGNSGHLFSEHYSDQYERYCNKQYRIQRMSRNRFAGEKHLVLTPVYPT